MVDGRESAHQRQGQGHLPGRLGGGHQQARQAHANIEHHHHATPAPEVAQTACGDGPDAKKDESAHGVGHHVFPAPHPEVDGNGTHRRGKDQQEQVIQGMAHIQQQRSQFGHAPIVARVSALC